MHEFTSGGINFLYKSVCKKLIEKPDYNLHPRGLETNELVNASLELFDPRYRLLTLKSRNISLRYLAGELAFYFSCSRSLNFIIHYSKFWKKVSDNGRTVNSCYGYKIFKKRIKNVTQFNYTRQQLLVDKDTRKAMIMIYTNENTQFDSHDNVCTICLQFLIRNDKLILITTMRSQDIVFGLTYDIPFFTILQEIMLLFLKKKYPELQLGSYIHNVGSLHYYHKDRKMVWNCAYDDLIAPPQKMPIISRRTLEQMPAFLTYEEQLRRNRKAVHKFNDPFLRTLKRWLLEEK